MYLKRASASEVVGSTNFGMYGGRREFVCYQTGCLVEVSNDDNTSRKKKAGVAKETGNNSSSRRLIRRLGLQGAAALAGKRG